MPLIKFFTLSLLSVSVAYAHDDAIPTPRNIEAAADAASPVVETHKLELFAGLGMQALHGAKAYPAARLPGVLEAGSARSDQRGDGLDYAEIGARAQFMSTLSGQLNLARHGGKGGSNDVDQAWLDFHDSVAEHGYAARAGRQLVPLGLLNLQHAHTRDFGIAPLTMRAMVNDAWRADGVRLDAELGAGFAAGVGAWMQQGFPGTVSNRPDMQSARLAWSDAQFKFEAGYVHTAINQRALSTVGLAGHTHSVPTCTVASATLVCLQGAANIWTLAGRWQAAADSVWLGGEYWNKRETGTLRSNFGKPNYQGEMNGGWLEIGYPILPNLQVLARSEKLVAKHVLLGANAALVATQAGIFNSAQPLTSQAAAVRWQPYSGHHLSAEWTQQNLGANNFSAYLLRYQMELSVSLL
ncbi:MAG: hypothetical protein PXX73_02410 [Sideroxydans sp.]|nr:hypothetical protein [Sideroxydans sp.]